MDEQNKSTKKTGKHMKQTEDPRAAKRAAKAEEARLEKERRQAEREEEAARKEARREAKKQQKAERKKSGAGKAFGVALVVLLVVLLLGFGGLTAAGWYVTNQNTNLQNVYIGEYDVSGLTEAETLQLLRDKGWDEAKTEALHVTLPTGARFKLDYLEAGANHSAEVMAATAYSYGHDSGWFENLFTAIQTKVKPVNADTSEKVLNKAYIMDRISDGIAKYDAYMADTEYHLDVESGKLRILKGAGSVKLSPEDVYEKVSQALLAGEKELTIELENPVCAEVDFKTLSEQLNVEVQDAYFDEQFNVIPEVSGIILDADAARQIYDATPVTEYAEIPIQLNEPETTAAELEALLYRDMLASTTTYFKSSTGNRINNINLAAAAINGTILLPGEIFSYNGTVGERTAEAGFKMAGAYASGKVVEQLGGGICQVSSTLYKTTMLAQMKTIARTCHQFRVTYLDPGYDATVDWPNVDFQFQNVRDYPVKIVAYCDNDARSITIEIWGTDVDGSYVTLGYDTGIIYDPEWRELGYDVRTGTGVNCYVRIYDKDGNLIRNYVEDYSIYELHEEEIKTPNGMTIEEARAQKAAEESAGSNDSGGDGGGDYSGGDMVS